MALVNYTAFDSLGPKPAPIDVNFDELWLGSPEPHTLSLAELQLAVCRQMEIVLLQEQKTLSFSPETDLFNEVDVLYLEADYLSMIGKKIGIDHFESGSRAENQSIEQTLNCSTESEATLASDEEIRVTNPERMVNTSTVSALTLNIPPVGLASPPKEHSERYFTSVVASKSNEDIAQGKGSKIFRPDEREAILSLPDLVLGPDFQERKRHFSLGHKDLKVKSISDRDRKSSGYKAYICRDYIETFPEVQQYNRWLTLSIALAIVRVMKTLFWCRYGATAPYSLFSETGRASIKSPDVSQGNSWVVPLMGILLQV